MRIKFGQIVNIWLWLCLFGSATTQAQSSGATLVYGYMGASPSLRLQGSTHYGWLSLEASVGQVLGQRATLYPLLGQFTFELSQQGVLRPFGFLGGGLFVTRAVNAVAEAMITTPAACFGAGVRYWLWKEFAFTLESRQLFTSVRNAQEDREELLIFQELGFGVQILW